MRSNVTSVVETASLVSIIAGVSMFSFALGLVVAGGIGLWTSYRMTRR